MNANKIFLAIMLIASIGIAQAESGSIIISDDKTYNVTTQNNDYSPQGGNVSWNTFDFDTANYNYLSNFNVAPVGATYLHGFESTSFSIYSGATGGSGLAWYDQSTSKIYFVFPSDLVVTSSPIIVNYSKNIFANISGISLNSASDDTVGATKPVLIRKPISVYGNKALKGTYQDINVAVRATDFYEVTYPIPGYFMLNITKNPTLNSKYFINGFNSEYSRETTFNKINIVGAIFVYNDGIFLNATLSSGIFTNKLINSSGISEGGGTGAVTITTDKGSYQRGNIISITASNPSASNVYLTAYGPTGVMTDIIWNYKITAGTTQTITKVIKNDYPIGDYTINAATSQSYAPIVATTAFNISLPSNTSNSLGLLWSSNIYNFGDTGLVYTQGNFNETTLTISSPSNITQSFVFGANNTNTTGITMNENGQWTAYFVDNSNSSNSIISSTRVALAGNFFTDNETYSSCTSAPTFVCWGQNTYYPGGSWVIDYKITKNANDILFGYINATLEITNPDGKIVYTELLNYTDAIQLSTSGSFVGTFSTYATPGDYYARIYTNPFPVGIRDMRAVGATRLLASSASTVPTPTQPTQADMTNTANGLFSLFTHIALYGLVIFIGLVVGLVKLGVNGSAIIVLSGLIATFESLAGLFGEFGIYVILLTWIFASVYFKFGRDMTTGG